MITAKCVKGDLMFAKSRTVNRQYIGKNIQNFMELPDLIDIQLSSYESFLQKTKLDNKEPLASRGFRKCSILHSLSKVLTGIWSLNMNIMSLMSKI